jgi:probable selenium-dependent hydroxylase accessory protein YqeC
MNFFHIIHSHLNKLRGQVVSVIGGGGKSTLMDKIGKELKSKNLKVLLTGTTRFETLPDVELVIQNQNKNYLNRLKRVLEENKIALLAKDFYKEKRLVGIDRHDFSEIKSMADTILIEADGCRQRSLKTHKEYEPVIPEISTTVIIICGANVVGAPLNEETVHRAELFSQKWHLPLETLLTPEIVAKELLSHDSYLRHIPENAAVSIFINKADLNPDGGRLLAHELKGRCEYSIYLGSIAEGYLAKI